MSNEDDDVSFGGPPPDPSQRQWRHPSELAAAAAAAARLENERARGSSPRRGFSPTSFAIGSSIGIAACLAVYAFTTFSPGGTTLTDSERVAFPTSPTAATAATAPPATDDAGPATTDSATSGQVTTSTTRIDATSLDRPSLPAHLESIANNGLVAVYLDPSDRPIASGLLIDGVILTSASAVDAVAGTDPVPTLHIATRDRTYEVEVAGADRFSDLAVLVTDDVIDESSQRLGFITTASLDTEPNAAEAPDNPASDNPTSEDLTGRTITLLATDGQPVPIAVTGKVLAVDQQARTRDGHPIIGALSTSARLPEGGAGAVLVDDQGQAIGIVINGDGALASAIPLDSARQIASKLINHGWASDVWLGIEGRDLAPGVEVTRVDPTGPAAAAGFMAGDVLHSLGGSRVPDMASLVYVLRRLAPGDDVIAQVERKAGLVELAVTVEGYPSTDDGATTDDEALSEPADG